MRRVLEGLDVNLAAGSGILDCIVDQVADHRTQTFGVAHHCGCFATGHAQINALLQRQYGTLTHRLACQRIQRARMLLAPAHGLFLSRQIEQLLHQVGGPVDAGMQCGKRGVTFTVVNRALGQLGLQFQCRQRRTQFVRRIRHKCALRVKRVPQTIQQAIERTGQRPDFVRHIHG